MPGTRRLLDRAVADGARFLFTSTSEVYGDPLDHPQREDYRGHVSSTGPRSMYDESKRYAEALITAYAGRYGIERASCASSTLTGHIWRHTMGGW